MKRHESQLAKIEQRDSRTLNEIDYLLGVNDIARQGALRFKSAADGEFLATQNTEPIPPLVDIKKLLAAAEDMENDTENFEEIKLLLAPGSSLGGARPKASVIDKQGNLCIAKFPKNSDPHNLILWEAVALTLAKQAGLRTQDWFLEKIDGKDVIIMKRFDRIGNIRIPFLSAMSMLDAIDHDERTYSYLEIADTITQHGANAKMDLTELWKRIVFSVMISNTDDHLRNHGFLYESEKGWRLSPAYDINPNPENPKVLNTCITIDNNTADLDLALSVAEYFGLKSKEAKELVDDIKKSIYDWRDVARSFGIKRSEIELMERAFKA
jgi:serine/threonine-protein kinase HipA